MANWFISAPHDPSIHVFACDWSIGSSRHSRTYILTCLQMVGWSIHLGMARRLFPIREGVTVSRIRLYSASHTFARHKILLLGRIILRSAPLLGVTFSIVSFLLGMFPGRYLYSADFFQSSEFLGLLGLFWASLMGLINSLGPKPSYYFWASSFAPQAYEFKGKMNSDGWLILP